MIAGGPNPFGRAGPTPDDPMASLLGAMSDVWGAGLGVLQGMVGVRPGVAPGGGLDAGLRGFAGPAAGLFAAWAEFLARGIEGPAPRGTSHVDPMAAMQGAARQAADLATPLAQASAVALASTLRYGQGLAEVFARHQAGLAQAASARAAGEASLPPEQCRALADQLRAFLREISETALLEARRLEHELGQVSEAIAESQAPPADDRPYQRRWEVKP